MQSFLNRHSGETDCVKTLFFDGTLLPFEDQIKKPSHWSTEMGHKLRSIPPPGHTVSGGPGRSDLRGSSRACCGCIRGQFRAWRPWGSPFQGCLCRRPHCILRSVGDTSLYHFSLPANLSPPGRGNKFTPPSRECGVSRRVA